MRGIAFIGGEGPGPERGRLAASQAALVAAADSGLMGAEAAGVRPDWIVGDMDSLDDLRRLDRYPADRVIRSRRDKDFTDTELALSLLWEQGCDEVWLAGGGGGRIDHLFAIRSLFERDRFPSRWISSAEDIYCVQAPGKLELETGAGGLVSVFPLCSGPWQASGGGLKWPLDGLLWNRGFFGVSNEAPEGRFFVRAVQGRFMVIVPFNGVT
jgi:thiamine pyrophosphokinase